VRAASRLPDVVVTGYPSIDFIARTRDAVNAGWTGIIDELWQGPTYGGCGPNVAVGLARLGVAVGLAVILGDDADGQTYLAYLNAQGVDTRFVTILPGRRTSHTFLFAPARGPTNLFFHAGAAGEWAGPLALDFGPAKMAVLTVGPAPYNVAFAERAVAAGVPLAWQLKGDLTAYPRELLPRFATASRYVFMNRQEAGYVCGVLGVSSPHQLATRGPRAVFITRGEEGSEVATAAGVEVVPAVPATVVDPTGAGDAFTAGALAGLLRGWDPVRAARLGSTVASFVVERWGAQAGLPAWPEAAKRYARVFGSIEHPAAEGEGAREERGGT